ncbi:MAG: 2-C-methyl-D-erythritol 4-phosphate cytidylyltransferase [Planctomycetota bacterium]
MSGPRSMQVAVILPAAGLGSRFASGGVASRSKVEFELAGKPVFMHTIEAFRAVAEVTQIVLAVPPDGIDEFRFRWGDALSFSQAELVAGGRAERWETVQLALAEVDPACSHVAVHDAARPLVSPKLIERVFAAAERWPAVVPGLPVSSTLKRVGDAATASADPLDDLLGVETSPTADARPIIETVPRDGLYAVQTPQVFAADLLRRAYAQDLSGSAPTDDAGVVEALGETVHVVEGDPANLKITHPADAELAEAILAHRRQAAAAKKAIDLFDDEDD